jgi:hypothetical protein
MAGAARTQGEPDQDLAGGLGAGGGRRPGEGGAGLLSWGGGRGRGVWGGGTASSAANPITPTTSAASAWGTSRCRRANSDSGTIAATASSFNVRTCP